jgi:hypothetical protein
VVDREIGHGSRLTQLKNAARFFWCRLFFRVPAYDEQIIACPPAGVQQSRPQRLIRVNIFGAIVPLRQQIWRNAKKSRRFRRLEVDNREASNRVDRKPLECPMKDISVIVEKA